MPNTRIVGTAFIHNDFAGIDRLIKECGSGYVVTLVQTGQNKDNGVAEFVSTARYK